MQCSRRDPEHQRCPEYNQQDAADEAIAAMAAGGTTTDAKLDPAC